MASNTDFFTDIKLWNAKDALEKAIKRVFECRPHPVDIKTILSEAKVHMMSDDQDNDTIAFAMSKEIVLEVIKDMMDANVIKKIDSSTFCPPGCMPKYRGLDDTFCTYAWAPLSDVTLPSKNTVTKDAAKALALLGDSFTLKEFAEAWTTVGDPTLFKNLSQIFGITRGDATEKGRQSLIKVVKTLIGKGLVEEAIHSTILQLDDYRKVPHKSKKYRELDEE